VIAADAASIAGQVIGLILGSILALLLLALRLNLNARRNQAWLDWRANREVRQWNRHSRRVMKRAGYPREYWSASAARAVGQAPTDLGIDRQIENGRPVVAESTQPFTEALTPATDDELAENRRRIQWNYHEVTPR
jgi:hypothetical protein